MSYAHPAPDYRITVDGTDISPKINGRLISLSITDNRGLEADTLNLILSDHDGKLAIPPKGAEVQVWIGFKNLKPEQPLIDKGTYIISEVTHSGAPDQLTISGASADMTASLPGRKTRSWHKTTVGELVNAIAAEHSLEPAVAAALAGIRINHLDQTEESDLNLLTRQAEKHDAIATVKSGRLLFIPAAQASTLSGKPLPAITITRKQVDQHTYTDADRDSYAGVKAWWNNISGGKREAVLVGDGEKAKELRNTYASEEEATQAAQAELNRIQRGNCSLSVTLSRGRPDLIPETPIVMQGWKTQIDQTSWIATKITHSLSDSGLMTSFDAEVKSG